MKHSPVVSGMALSAGLIFLAATQPLTANDDEHDGHDKDNRVNIKLNGFNENLQALSTPAKGRFTAKINRGSVPSIDYELSYEGFPTAVQQAHIHFGTFYQNGGISVFLCTNLNNSPGTQACPTPAGTITGTIFAADVIGPAAQGIGAGEFGELLDAIDRGATYVNIHTVQYPGGEIRAQVNVR